MMYKKTIDMFLLLTIMIFPIYSVAAQNTSADLDAAMEWIESQLQEDGGFSNGFAPESDAGATADAVLAMVTIGRDPETVRTAAGASPIDFLRGWLNADQEVGAGIAAKITIALEAAGYESGSFSDRDLTGFILEDHDPASGMFGLGPFDSGLALLALIASEHEVPVGAIDALIATRLDDGSYAFSYDPSLVTGDSNTTAIVVQALIAVDMKNETGASIDYFRNTQNDDGGWTYQKPSEFGEDTDTNSTALAIQALRAAGEDLEEWGDPVVVLSALQEPSGAFAFSSTFTGDNMLATLQAIPTLAGADYVNPIPSEEASSNTNLYVALGALIIIVLILGAAIFVNRGSTVVDAA
jgi:prenyltransferase beta subunit